MLSECCISFAKYHCLDVLHDAIPNTNCRKYMVSKYQIPLTGSMNAINSIVFDQFQYNDKDFLPSNSTTNIVRLFSEYCNLFHISIYI